MCLVSSLHDYTYTVDLYDGNKTTVSLKEIQLFDVVNCLPNDSIQDGEKIGNLILNIKLLEMDISINVELHYKKSELQVPFDCVFYLPLVPKEQTLSQLNDGLLKELFQIKYVNHL
ncbi:hypothetical protein D7X33_22380 [Butyricicoccus sp. 1XD8-22]|nr:hypothetical protein D7X33_22380 [Butyricicoccus sp. 1XD8-22]